MKLKILLVYMCALICVSCSTINSSPNGLNGQGSPIRILVIRHGEKTLGLEHSSDIYLNVIGAMRSWALIPYFQNIAPKIAAIYAAPQGVEDEHSYRPMETCTPLAGAYGLTINANEQQVVGVKDLDALVMNISSTTQPGDTVVVCWEHTQIPGIMQAFGVTDAPAKWEGTVFDGVWEVLYYPTSKTAIFNQFTQNLPNSFVISQTAYDTAPISIMQSEFPAQFESLQTFCPGYACNIDWIKQVQCCDDLLYGTSLPPDNCQVTLAQCEGWYGFSK